MTWRQDGRHVKLTTTRYCYRYDSRQLSHGAHHRGNENNRMNDVNTNGCKMGFGIRRHVRQRTLLKSDLSFYLIEQTEKFKSKNIKNKPVSIISPVQSHDL